MRYAAIPALLLACTFAWFYWFAPTTNPLLISWGIRETPLHARLARVGWKCTCPSFPPVFTFLTLDVAPPVAACAGQRNFLRNTRALPWEKPTVDCSPPSPTLDYWNDNGSSFNCDDERLRMPGGVCSESY